MELALNINPAISRLSEYVQVIKSEDLEGFAARLEKDGAFLDTLLGEGQFNGRVALLMAILARFRAEQLDADLARQMISFVVHNERGWGDVRDALLKTIPCSSTMSDINRMRLGHLLICLILDGLESNGELDDWAGGWLAYSLQGHAWNKMIKESPEWARSRGLSTLDFAPHSNYEFPAALILLGARKDAVPPWTREQGTARHYAIKSKDPILRYIVMYDEYAQVKDGVPKQPGLHVHEEV